MLKIEEINTSHKHYPFIEKLMQTAFPYQERRDPEQQKKVVDNNPLFTNLLILENEVPIGFITYWDLSKFYYIEHFAIDIPYRNNGYGKKALEMIKSHLKKPIILEVDEPTDEITNRRILFYRRLGFDIHLDYPYLQPPYRKGDKWFPLKLMTYGLNMNNEQLEACKNLIYQIVYLV